MWILISALIILATGVAIFWPYLRPKTVKNQNISVDPQLAELYINRDMLYQSIRDAKFDLDMGKLSQEDYEQQTQRMKRRAAVVLRNIDNLEVELVAPELDAQVEAEIAAARNMPVSLKASAENGKGNTVDNGARTRFCGQCGTTLRAGDRFCGRCGASVNI